MASPSRSSVPARRDLVLALSPFEEPNARLVLAAHRAGAQGVLDLGRDGPAARRALAMLDKGPRGAYGARVPVGCPVAAGELPASVGFVVLAQGSPWGIGDVRAGMRVLVEVSSVGQAQAAMASQAGTVHGLVARGDEAGGAGGDGLTTFLLLQHLLADATFRRTPVWALGGIGCHTAASAVAGGARGVVLDAQLALTKEGAADLPADVVAALRAMDGSETARVAGHRVYRRPDLPGLDLLGVELAGQEAAGEEDAGERERVARVLGARGLRRQLLPVGQDGATARVFAERYGTTGRVCRAVRDAVADHLADAVRVRPLAPERSGGPARGVGTGTVADRGRPDRVTPPSAVDAGARERPAASDAGVPASADGRAAAGPSAAPGGPGPRAGEGAGDARPASPAGEVRGAAGARGDATGVLPDAAAAHPATAGSGRDTTGAGPDAPDALPPRLPVAQGPMTRVSDRAAFARAVADDGALPFLALALMRGNDVRRLLARTAGRLGTRPWGVGLLGFAPRELRDEQLDAVLAARPPYALIAGGRPAQAAPLEAAGIRTYLHVPAPGLLGAFLREGARRFVFEGMECGGHVGPRASFPLWDAQIDILLTHCRQHPSSAPELDLLFAGGIHDARSAAMVAAAAAPLAALGARVGVLMGTAYLFTEEAVTSGAIQPGFQRAAVACDGTALLETGPGHVTRCAVTPYVETFARAREDLTNRGVPARDMWAELEQLNLGRLRLASKGVRREGAELVTVDEETQEREGMVMIGQAAALRSERTTVAALHTGVTVGACRFLDERVHELGLDARQSDGPGAEPEPLDVAVVGMACVFPGAPDLAAFWRLVTSAGNAVTEVPATRWDTGHYYGDGPGRTPSRWGGFLPRIPFDATVYGIPPASLGSIEPAQLLALHTAAGALEDAGYGAGRAFDRSRTSVVFGAEAGTDLAGAYGFRSLYPAFFGDPPPELDSHLPRTTEDSFPGVLANVIAGRIANRFDLGGSNYTVDAACAASLAALDLACSELRRGTSDMVLCGGVDTHNGINDYLMFTSVRALSPSGRCATFDASADGIALGEGAACVVLKRLADAQRDGDRVYAVVKGVGASSDGRSLGLTAPRPEGQRRALERAYRQAGVSPAEVGLVEAHGTGTVVGDRAELETLTSVFEAAGVAPASCSLGSVKSQIGHTKCAAGMAGLIKASLAVYEGVRPPTVHLRAPNPGWDAASSPFVFDAQVRPWHAQGGERIAGVSAFGFGGTNFHAVIAACQDAEPDGLRSRDWPAELFLFSGTDEAAARSEAERLKGLLEAPDAPRSLRALAALQSARHISTPVWLAVVADDIDDLAAHLAHALDGTPDPRVLRRTAAARVDPPRVAFLYPGQGSQRPGMLADLFATFPGLDGVLEEAAAADATWLPAMFPPTAFTAEERERRRAAVTDTRVAQPVLGVAAVGATLALARAGVRPDDAAGHSYGELAALWAAGTYDTTTLLRLSSLRAQAVADAAGADPGSMAAIAAAPDDVEAVLASTGLAGRVVVANRNTPTQSVISGPTADVEHASAELAAAEFQVRPLNVACAFHSDVVAGAAPALAAVLAAEDLHAPGITVWSNTTAGRYPDADPQAVRDLLARQVAAPVRFCDQIEAMYADGVRVFVEVGPGRALTGMVNSILGAKSAEGTERPCTAVAIDVPGEDGVRSLLLALAELAVAGVTVDAAALTRDRVVEADLERTARPRWTVDGHLVRGDDGQPVAGGLHPAVRLAANPFDGGAMHTDSHGGADAREAAVMAYLTAAREQIAAQRDVLLGYLGAGRAEPVVLGATVVTPPQPHPVREIAPTVAEPAAPASAEPLTHERVMAAVLDVVGARTGYPRDMLDPRLDLEADLSVDSIKRTEIVGELAVRLGLPGAGSAVDEALVEELSAVKTIDGIVAKVLAAATATEQEAPAPVGATAAEALMDAAPPDAAATGTHHAGPATLTAPRAAVRPTAARPTTQPTQPLVLAPVRHVVETEPLPDLTDAVLPDLTGLRFAVVEDGHGIAWALADHLDRAGADVHVVTGGRTTELPERTDALVHLGALVPDPARRPLAPDAYPLLRRALTSGLRRVLVATDSAEGLSSVGAGLAGLVRTAALEYPDAAVRLVDVDAKDESVPVLVRQLLRELYAPAGPPVVTFRDGHRRTTRVAASPLAPETAHRDRALGRDSVVLLTGGARGITARTAVGLARTTGCRIELLGRTAPPEPGTAEEPAVAAATDRNALRAALVSRGLRDTAAVEAEASRILAQREVAATVAACVRAGSPTVVHRADVSDPRAVEAVIADIAARHGRLDGIVHGAGLLDDHLIADKDPDAFCRVFDVKVGGAYALTDALRSAVEHGSLDRHPAFLALFGSVAGVFGNRGQSDYAAANDALDTLAHGWAALADRVVAVDWGPWAAASGGMVDDALERVYARRGIPLIEPEAGVAALLGELTYGWGHQVVFLPVAPDAAHTLRGAL